MSVSSTALVATANHKRKRDENGEDGKKENEEEEEEEKEKEKKKKKKMVAFRHIIKRINDNRGKPIRIYFIFTDNDDERIYIKMEVFDQPVQYAIRDTRALDRVDIPVYVVADNFLNNHNRDNNNNNNKQLHDRGILCCEAKNDADMFSIAQAGSVFWESDTQLRFCYESRWLGDVLFIKLLEKPFWRSTNGYDAEITAWIDFEREYYSTELHQILQTKQFPRELLQLCSSYLESPFERKHPRPCHNYDFITNWKTVSTILLQSPVRTNAIIKEAWKLYKKLYPQSWDADTLPPSDVVSPSESMDDYFYSVRCGLYDHFQAQRKSPNYSLVFTKAENDELDALPPATRAYKFMGVVLSRLGYEWKTNKDKPTFYLPYSAAHSWNATFGLWLAQRVRPEVKWVVRKGKLHTTVYNPENHEVFDILYFFSETSKRHDAYVAGTFDPNTDVDPTFGGDQAFRDSQ